MPAGQRVELLIGRRSRGMVAVPATYVQHVVRGRPAGERRLGDAERRQVAGAAKLLADAIGGVPVDDLELNNAVELLHRLALETEGTPRFRLADNRLVEDDDLSYRAALST
jgi:hypothetical protein